MTARKKINIATQFTDTNLIIVKRQISSLKTFFFAPKAIRTHIYYNDIYVTEEKIKTCIVQSDFQSLKGSNNEKNSTDTVNTQ